MQKLIVLSVICISYPIIYAVRLTIIIIEGVKLFTSLMQESIVSICLYFSLVINGVKISVIVMKTLIVKIFLYIFFKQQCCKIVYINHASIDVLKGSVFLIQATMVLCDLYF